MANFDSPVNRRQAAMAQEQPMRKFVVDNAEEQIPEQENIEEKVAEMRKAKQQVNQLSPGAKARIEILSGLGRATKDVDIDGIKFSLRTLKAAEQKEVITAASQVALNVEAMYTHRTHTLARAIYEIDNQPIGDILGSNYLEVKLFYVEELDEAVTNFLFDNYNQIVKQNTKKFAITTEEEVKGVVDDITKSS